uniref:Uncharacterized protein n=1 Tax=uncultured prokaryote TaxID=198431 RepID=A0A0H5Q2N4_9ZZZZ|nr:hypothetical protein [uncultured prokaryote]
MNPVSITVTINTYQHEGYYNVRLVSWGDVGGKYGSQCAFSMRREGTVDIKDPEEFLSLILSSVSSLVYHS